MGKILDFFKHKGIKNYPLKVTKEDWKTNEIPSNCAIHNFACDRIISEADFEKLKLGHIPAEMEDKFFIVSEDDYPFTAVRIYSGWSGNILYTILFDNAYDEKEDSDYAKVEVYAYYDDTKIKENVLIEKGIYSSPEDFLERRFYEILDFYLGEDYERYIKFLKEHHNLFPKKGF